MILALLKIESLELSNLGLLGVSKELIKVLDVEPAVLKPLGIINPGPLLVVKDVLGKSTVLFHKTVGEEFLLFLRHVLNLIPP